MTPPLVTTFAGDSVRAEGMFVSTGGSAYQNLYVWTSSGGYIISLATFSVIGTNNYATGGSLAYAFEVDKANANVYTFGYGPTGYGYLQQYPTTSTWSPVARQEVSLSSSYFAFALNPAGTLAYVPNSNGYGIASVSVPSLSATGTNLTLPSFVNTFYCDNLNQYVYVTNTANTVQRVATSLGSYSTLTISAASGYYTLSFVADSTNTYGYVGCSNGVIYQINMSTFALTGKTFSPGGYNNVQGLLIDKTNTYLYAWTAQGGGSSQYSEIIQINISTGSATASYYPAAGSTSAGAGQGSQSLMALDPNGLYIYAIQYNSLNITRITIAGGAQTTLSLGGNSPFALGIGYIG
jgi:hypothetical protein